MKPFNLNEFLLRGLRDAETLQPGTVPNRLRKGTALATAMCFSSPIMQKRRREKSILTELEVKMLSFFFRNEGKAVSGADLLEIVGDISADTETRTLDNFIVRLRRYFNRTRHIRFTFRQCAGWVSFCPGTEKETGRKSGSGEKSLTGRHTIEAARNMQKSRRGKPIRLF